MSFSGNRLDTELKKNQVPRNYHILLFTIILCQPNQSTSFLIALKSSSGGDVTGGLMKNQENQTMDQSER